MPEALIENALNKLASEQEGVFLIFEDDQSGKFMQFAGSRTEPLVLACRFSSSRVSLEDMQNGC